jgi:hypothetical protein
MAYGVKYQLLCVGMNGVSSKTVISEDGYSGAEIDRNIPTNPFRLRLDNGGVVRGSSLEFGIREAVDWEFLQFYTNNPKKFKVQFYYPDTTLIWSGYINPQQYDAEYKAVPNTLFFQATDGLGLLKQEAFTLTGRNSELTIIRHCLDKIGLALGYAIAIDLWEINQDSSLTVLDQTYIDSVVFSGMKCYEVLEGILGNGKYDATIRQWNNRWRIVSNKDKKGVRMLYSSAGSYTGTEVAQGVLDLIGTAGSGNQVWPVGNALWMKLKPGGKGVKFTQDYGRKLSLLDGYDFNLYASSMFTYWTKSGTFGVAQGVTKEGKYYCRLSGYSNVDTDHIYQAIPITNAPNEDFVFEFDFAPLGASFTASTGKNPISMAVRVLVKLTVGATVYYLTSTGWDITLAYITVTVDSSIGEPIFTHVKIVTDEIPGSGTLEVRLMRYKSAPPGASYVFTGMDFSDILAYFMNDNELYPAKLEDTVMFDDSTEPEMLDDMEVLAADAPDLINKGQLYVSITRLSDGTPTLTWNMAGNDTDFTLLNLYLKMLASRNIYPRQQLDGEIRGEQIGFECLIKHAYNGDREFEIDSCSWDVYANRWMVTLMEWFGWSDRDLTFDSGYVLGGAADLTVATVVPADLSLDQEQAVNVTVHVNNTGESAGRQLIEWKWVDDDDTTITSGSVASGSIPGADDADCVLAMTGPDTAGSYYFKAKIATDTEWVSSAEVTVAVLPSITLNSVAAIADGTSGDAMSVSFNATNAGGAGTVTIYWQTRDSGHSVVGSGSEDVSFGTGTNNYNLTSVVYPMLAGTNYDLRIGMSAGTMVLTSNHYEVTL